MIFVLMNVQVVNATQEQLTPKMIEVPAGGFLMGSDDARPAETPVHRVNIKAFYMSETEITQAQWMAVMENNPSDFKGCMDCPVEQVSWHDVQEYIKKLNTMTGKNYRLPSEAEWEYACRSGGKNEPFCGGRKRYDVGWYLNNSGRKVRKVKQKAPNGLGLYDMSGNIFEWVQDCWNPNYEGAPNDGSAWLSRKCNERVLRGGSWNTFSTPGYMRSVVRFKQFSDKRHNVFGFRLVHDLKYGN